MNNRLFRSLRNGNASHAYYLEDYANLILALLSAYQVDHQTRWYQSAFTLTEQMIALFKDPNSGFFDTAIDHETLISRPKDLQDNASPSGNSLAATALFKMSLLTGREEWRLMAYESLGVIKEVALKYPQGFSNWLCAADFVLSNPKEVAIVGSHNDLPTFTKPIWSTYRPNLVLAGSEMPVSPDAPPLLQGRTSIHGKTTAYVCQNFVRKLPVITPEELLSLLK